MSTSKTKKKIKRLRKSRRKKSVGSGPSGSSTSSRSRQRSNAVSNSTPTRRSRANAVTATTAVRPKSTNSPTRSSTNSSTPKAPVNTVLSPSTVKRASVKDFNSGRTLFATQRANGKKEYLPKRSEASDAELARGKYVPNDAVEMPSIDNTVLNKRSVFDFNEQRTLFATQAKNGDTEYLPSKSEATAYELSTGRYISDSKVKPKAALGADGAMRDLKPRYDLGRGRTVYAVKTADNKTRYLPRESEASAYERSQGIYIPDGVVDRHESQRRRTALKGNTAQQNRRRAQRASRLPGQSTSTKKIAKPVTQAKDGTPLWDGFTPPIVSPQKQKETLNNLKPKYDVGKGRMTYPTETAPGKVEYLPLAKEATQHEYSRGLYAAFVPRESLEDFLDHESKNNTISRQPFETEQGNVSAYAQEDIEQALEQSPALVLRSARFVGDRAREVPELQQQLSAPRTK